MRAIQPLDGYEVVRLPAIAFRGFGIADGGPDATPNQILTLPNGKRLTVGQYLEQVNAIERQLNTVGHSLRTLPETRLDLAALRQGRGAVIVRPVINRATLAGQRRTIASGHGIRAVPALRFDQQVASLRSRMVPLRTDQGRLNQIRIFNSTQPQVAVSAAAASLPWLMAPGIGRDIGPFELGDRRTFYANLRGSYSLRGYPQRSRLAARAIAEGSVIKIPLEFLRLDAEFISPAGEGSSAKPGTALLSLRLLGEEYSILDEGGALWSKEGAPKWRKDWGEEFTFYVGGVRMSVEIGAHVSGGVKYYAELQPLAVAGTLTPWVHAEAYGQLAVVDLEVTEAGLEVQLVLLDDELVLSGSGVIRVDAEGKPFLQVDASGINTMDMLDGAAYLYTCAWVVHSWSRPFVEKCWYKRFWDDEPQIQIDSELFKIREAIYFN